MVKRSFILQKPHNTRHQNLRLGSSGTNPDQEWRKINGSTQWYHCEPTTNPPKIDCARYWLTQGQLYQWQPTSRGETTCGCHKHRKDSYWGQVSADHQVTGLEKRPPWPRYLGTKPYYSITPGPLHRFQCIWPLVALSQYKKPSELNTQATRYTTGGSNPGLHQLSHWTEGPLALVRIYPPDIFETVVGLKSLL